MKQAIHLKDRKHDTVSRRGRHFIYRRDNRKCIFPTLGHHNLTSPPHSPLETLEIGDRYLRCPFASPSPQVESIPIRHSNRRFFRGDTGLRGENCLSESIGVLIPCILRWIPPLAPPIHYPLAHPQGTYLPFRLTFNSPHPISSSSSIISCFRNEIDLSSK